MKTTHVQIGYTRNKDQHSQFFFYSLILLCFSSPGLLYGKPETAPPSKAKQASQKSKTTSEISQMDCSITNVLSGPVSGVIQKSCRLSCDKKSEDQFKACRKIEETKNPVVKEHNRLILKDETQYSEAFLKQRKEVREHRAKIEELDRFLEDQNCKNTDGSYRTSGQCRDLVNDRNNFITSVNPQLAQFNLLAKDLNSILHPKVLETKTRLAELDAELAICRTEASQLEDECKKLAREAIYATEIHQGYERPEKGTPDRAFEFHVGENKSDSIRQSRLLVMDAPTERPSNEQSSLMIFFPRTQAAVVQVQEDKSIAVVLGNGEKIRFSPTEHIPTDGVLIQTHGVSRNRLAPAGLKYVGNKFMLRADWVGDSFAKKKKVMLFGPQGKQCDLSKHGSSIWNSDMEFKFSTDADWNDFTKQRYGFSIAN